MAGRSRTLPVMSMLDLLFGVFGVMIVLAAALSQQRAAEPRVDRTPFLDLVVMLEGPSGLDAVFVDFVHTSSGRELRWSPLVETGAGTEREGIYLAAMGPRGPVASLTLGETFLGDGARLSASLQNLSRLPAEGEIILTLFARTAHNACPLRRVLAVEDLRQAERRTASGLTAPSVFGLMAENGRLCQSTGPGLRFVVSEGWLELRYAAD